PIPPPQLTTRLPACILSVMGQIPLFQPEPPPTWSVTDLTRYLRDLLESDYNLQDVWVSGEISNFSRPRSGHLYFTLKDAKASLRCVVWRGQAARLRFLPQDGDAVEVHGKISVYEAGGQYQLYANAIRQTGEGARYREFLRVKAKLEAEGLFDETRKRPIPDWPRRIGIITSPTGAALQDMLNTIRRRYPLADVILTPTAVQGADAPPGIVRGVIALNKHSPPPDVILVARGGGSIEDLWAFNDEFVARAIAGSAIPVITGVGHETDFTIADFAADLRAPTPTAAAELATPDQVELRHTLAEQTAGLNRALHAAVAARRWQLTAWQRRLRARSPRARLQNDRQRLDNLIRRAAVGLAHRLQIQRARTEGLARRLESLSPFAVLARGYAVVTHRFDPAQRKPRLGAVRSVGQVQVGDQLGVRVSDGMFPVEVKEKSK
ncbi:MAG: exodeoxyribonuclease VII large subunit, partial [Anaerolineales bacterium]